MMAKTSKAARIWELLQAGKTPKAIAAEVGCLPEYVRAVRMRATERQRERDRVRTWQAANPDKVRATHRRWYWERGGKQYMARKWAARQAAKAGAAP